MRHPTRRAGFALAAAFLLSPALPPDAAASAPAAPGSERQSTLDLSGMTFVDTRADQNEVVLQARQVHLPQGTDVAQLQDVYVRMSGQATRKGAFEMTCERGDLALGSSDFRAEGNVQGLTGDGRRFSTTWVRYDSDRGVVSTEAPVRIDDGVRVLRGNGFRYHVRDGRFVLSGGATVVQE